MSLRHILSALLFSLVLSLTGGVGSSAFNALAQESQPNVDSPASILQALEQHKGERVKLKLVSGQDLEGKLAGIAGEVVVVNELTGMEFFSATVRLDQVAAVIVRTRAK